MAAAEDGQAPTVPTTPAPRVSVGIPVFNGENFLAHAIESVLAQSYQDFELIICDNASTDATEAICRRYAAADQRIRYFRNARNLGAGPNYDLCFEHARGVFFKWMAHDDAIAPTFLAETVRRLEAHPEAVLCCVNVCEIDDDGRVVREFDSGLPDTRGLGRSERFRAAVRQRHFCTDIFGVFRREAMLGSQLHGTYRDSDRVLLTEMALRGPFVKVDAHLLMNRNHQSRFIHTAWRHRSHTAAWFDTSNPRRQRLPFWYHGGRYVALVRRYVPNWRERLACYRAIAQWALRYRHLLANDIKQELRLTAIELAPSRRRFGAGPGGASEPVHPSADSHRH